MDLVSTMSSVNILHVTTAGSPYWQYLGTPNPFSSLTVSWSRFRYEATVWRLPQHLCSERVQLSDIMLQSWRQSCWISCNWNKEPATQMDKPHLRPHSLVVSSRGSIEQKQGLNDLKAAHQSRLCVSSGKGYYVKRQSARADMQDFRQRRTIIRLLIWLDPPGNLLILKETELATEGDKLEVTWMQLNLCC